MLTDKLNDIMHFYFLLTIDFVFVIINYILLLSEKAHFLKQSELKYSEYISKTAQRKMY